MFAFLYFRYYRNSLNISSRFLSVLPNLRPKVNDFETSNNITNELNKNDINFLIARRKKLKLIMESCEADKWSKIAPNGLLNGYFQVRFHRK